MILEIYAKNKALLATQTVQAEGVPRVGEYVELPPDVAASAQSQPRALVYDVTWQLTLDKLEPIVSCLVREDEPSNRRQLLESEGWLQACS